MTDHGALVRLVQLLDHRAEIGNPARFWLRDDDAVQPGHELDQLLAIAATHKIPLTLAVIPFSTGESLAQRLASELNVSVAVHGWSHTNYAPDSEKKQELGLHRQRDQVLKELSDGFRHLKALYPQKFVPLLVPPWNRIASEVVMELPGQGFRAFSAFGPSFKAPLAVINTNVDIIDWRGTRGGRPSDELFHEIIAHLQSSNDPVGILTHHLDHDQAAWMFLERLFSATSNHPGCNWVPVTELVG